MENVPEILEELVERHGLLHVVASLDTVCADKAALLSAEGRSPESARQWNRCANALYTAASKVQETDC